MTCERFKVRVLSRLSAFHGVLYSALRGIEVSYHLKLAQFFRRGSLLCLECGAVVIYPCPVDEWYFSPKRGGVRCPQCIELLWDAMGYAIHNGEPFMRGIA